MKTLYLDCGMGAAGDMFMAALLELHPDPQAFLRRLHEAGIPDVTVEAEKTVKCGITGTHIKVTWRGREEHSHDHDVRHDHGHTHDHSHTHDHDHSDHSHDHTHDHDHSDHTHDHSDHTHDHTHDHDHTAHHHHGQEPRPHPDKHAHHHHFSMQDVETLLQTLHAPDRALGDALAVYRLIAEAESHAHGVPVQDIHFHELGTMDAVADIVGCCMLVGELAPERFAASPVHVGSGHVRCAHGVLPVPAPATAHILRGVPIYGGSIQGELCTPTGAALLGHFVQEFGNMPTMRVSAVGYGMGAKDFGVLNCLRAFLGDAI